MTKRLSNDLDKIERAVYQAIEKFGRDRFAMMLTHKHEVEHGFKEDSHVDRAEQGIFKRCLPEI